MRWLQRRNISFDPIAFPIHESGNFKAKPVTARTMKLTARITCWVRWERLMRNTVRSAAR